MTRAGAVRRMPSKRRVLMVSSTGGHWVQMRRLEPAFDDWELHYACTDAGHRQSVPQPGRFHACPEASQWARLRLAWQLVVVVLVLLLIHINYCYFNKNNNYSYKIRF